MLTTDQMSQGSESSATQDTNACRWFYYTRPTETQIAYLEQELKVPVGYIHDSLDIGERVRIERNNGIIFVVLRVSYFQGNLASVPYITMPVGVVLTNEQIITICQVETDVIQGLKDKSATSCEHFLLQLLLETTIVFLRHLQQINQLVDETEERLKHSTRNKEVLQLLKYQKCLVYFTTALRANELMLERLQKSEWLVLNEAETALWEDVLIEQQQALELTSVAENILSQTMDAFASIISNNLNVVLEFLAAITIILALPTLVASFYGMNVSLPFADSPFAFSALVAISLLVSLVVALIFVRRRWL